MAQNTQETFDWVLSAVKTYLEYFCFVFCQKWTRFVKEELYQIAIKFKSLAMISMATMYAFFFQFRSAGPPVEPTTHVTIDNLLAHLANLLIYIGGHGSLVVIALH